MTPKKILSRAEKLLRQGWAQGSQVSVPEHRYCLSSAACTALWMRGGSPRAWGRVRQAICDEIGAPEWAWVMRWNDAPGRTQEEVIQAVRNSKQWLNLTAKERFFFEMHRGWQAVGALPKAARFRRRNT